MAGSSYGTIFRITTWGESHGKGLGVVVDGCPAGLPLKASDIQEYLNRRRPGRSRYSTQRTENDLVEILSGVFEGRTTGTPISLMVRNFFTYMKTRFILQILYRNANMYLHYLRIIDKKSEQIESQLHRSQRNKELIELLELEKCLVYFTTSLRSNEMVLEKLMKIDSIKHYPEDEDLLEDVIIENKQAIEMADIYSNILRDTTEAVASIINNNLNIVMKFLATVTLVISVPNIIFSAYGMNVRSESMPFADSPYGFPILCGIALGVCLVLVFIMAKKKFF